LLSEDQITFAKAEAAAEESAVQETHAS